MRFSTPYIAPVDKVMQMVHIIVLAIVVVPLALPRVGWRRRSGKGFPARPPVRRGNQYWQLRVQQAFRFRTFIWWHTIHEQPWWPRPVRPFPRTTLRVLILHREVLHYIAGDNREQRLSKSSDTRDNILRGFYETVGKIFMIRVARTTPATKLPVCLALPACRLGSSARRAGCRLPIAEYLPTRSARGSATTADAKTAQRGQTPAKHWYDNEVEKQWRESDYIQK